MTSNTLNTNLNADLLDGQEGAYYLNTATALAGDVAGAYNNLQIAADAVGSAEIANNAVGTTEIADGSVTSADIADLTVATGDIAFNFIGSVDGVINKGGDVDLVAGNGITITPNDVSNTITFTANVTAVDHNSLSNLAVGDVHTQYMKKAGDTMTGQLTNTYNTGAPFAITSNTLNTNLNADLLDGNHSAAFMTAATDNWVNTTGDTMTGQLTSTVATGTAPFVITSGTKVSNLNADNADTLDGYHASSFMTTATDVWINSTGDTMTGQLTNTYNTGSPFVITSTTVNTNLNADLLDGNHAADFMTATTDNWVNTTGDTMTGALSLTANTGGDALHVQQDGSGGTLNLGRYNTAGTLPMLNGDTNVQVPFMNFLYSGNPRFFVDYTGNVYATGTIAANAFSGTNTGGAGSAGYFEITNAGNNSPALSAITAGSSYAIYARADNGPSVYAESGGGGAFYADVNDGTDGLIVNISGSGYGVYVNNSNGTSGKAGYFTNSNLANTAPALMGSSNGSSASSYGVLGQAAVGYGVYAYNGVSAVLYGGNSVAGTGNLMELKKSGVNKFVVDNLGVVTSGCPTGFASIAGNYCIDTAPHAGLPWMNALDTCRGINASVCDFSEIWNGCRTGGIGFVANATYWTSSMSGVGSSAFFFQDSNASCNTAPNSGAAAVGTLYPYYCCKRK